MAYLPSLMGGNNTGQMGGASFGAQANPGIGASLGSASPSYMTSIGANSAGMGKGSDYMPNFAGYETPQQTLDKPFSIPGLESGKQEGNDIMSSVLKKMPDMLAALNGGEGGLVPEAEKISSLGFPAPGSKAQMGGQQQESMSLNDLLSMMQRQQGSSHNMSKGMNYSPYKL